MQANHPDFMVFTGNANPGLAAEIAHNLGTSLGAARVGRFSDGEVTVEINQNVRARDVFVVQSTCAPTNENLMELLIMVDALKRASAERISAVIPYFGYARQDRRPRSSRVPISAKVVANLLETVGVERVLTMDLHADQIQGFFDIPVDNIYASPVLLGDLRAKNYEDLIVVSPDVGGVVRARALAKQLELRPGHHRQASPQGERQRSDERDRRDRRPQLRDHGRHDRHRRHAGQSGRSAEGTRRQEASTPIARTRSSRVRPSNASRRAAALDEVVVTNTIPLSDAALGCGKIRQLSVAPLIAETIQRIAKGESVMSLFSDQDNLF
jgi:ribose-phosphate pyrophosphokinase